MHALTCLDATTGEHVWTVKLKRPTGPIAFRDGLAIGDGGTLHLFDWSGKRVAKQAIGASRIDALAADGGALFVATCKKSAIVQLEPRTLEVVRTFPIAGTWAAGTPPAFGKGALYVNAYAPWLLCFDRASGRQRWKKATAAGRPGGCAAIGDRVVYSAPALTAVGTDGKPRWALDDDVVDFVVRDASIVAVTIADDWSYELLEVAVSDGAVRSRLRLGTAPELSRDLWQTNGLAVIDGAIYAAHAAGAVYGLRA
jgi:outer membrane protein assembly factor BamB